MTTKMVKQAAVVLAGAAIGNSVAEMFVLKQGEDGSGFVPVRYGFGMDDIARAALIAGATLLLQKVV
jgi:hypothetical protein